AAAYAEYEHVALGLLARLARAVEALEDPREVGDRDARPLVLHAHHALLAAPEPDHAHFPADRRELGGVAEQVEEQAAQQVAVGFDLQPRSDLHRGADAPRLEHRLQAFQ